MPKHQVQENVVRVPKKISASFDKAHFRMTKISTIKKKKHTKEKHCRIFNIQIDFKKIAKQRKASKNVTKCIYSTFPYDNSSFGDTRFPENHTVPEHLLQEFKFIFPQKKDLLKKKKGKIPLMPEAFICGRALGVLKWIVEYHWQHTFNLDYLARIILHQKKVTLSNFDWCCTNYSKVFDSECRYSLNNRGDANFFSIHDSYQQNLELHLRALFDVYSRKTKILVEWKTQDAELFDTFMKGEEWGNDIKWDNLKNVGMRKVQGDKMIYLITSVAQLNFFRWAMRNKVVEFCIEHCEEISQHHDEIKKDKNSSKDGKRRKLSTVRQSALGIVENEMVVKYINNNVIMHISNVDENPDNEECDVPSLRKENDKSLEEEYDFSD